MSFLAAFDDDRRVRAGIGNFERFRKVLVAVSAVSAERGPANLVMTGPSDDTGAREWLRSARATTDTSIDVAADAMTGDEPSLRQVREQLRAVRTRLGEARAVVDAVIATEPAKRTPDAVTRAILAMFSAADGTEKARLQASRPVTEVTPELNIEVFLAIAASGLREHAGRFGSYVVMQLVPDSSYRETAFERMFETAGRLGALRRSVEALTSPMGVAPIETAMATLETHLFEGSMPEAAVIARNARIGQVMSVQAFTDLYVPNLRLADDLREAVAAASRQKLDHLRSRALTKLIVSGALTALVCLIVIGTIFIFRRALFHPLTTARRQVMALASGDLSEPRLEGPVGTEVGEMLAGLNTLRDEQRYQRELDDARRLMAEELLRLAQTDMLTGLLNRRALEAEAARMLTAADASGEALGLVMFDIDHFKRINDTYGHGTGDVVLKRIARELSSLVRPGAVFGRYGGEEFLLLLPNAVRSEAERVAGLLRARVETMIFPEAPQLSVTASFGVATRAPGSVATWEALLAMADRRLYAAKRSGRNQVCSDDDSPGWRWIAA